MSAEPVGMREQRWLWKSLEPLQLGSGITGLPTEAKMGRNHEGGTESKTGKPSPRKRASVASSMASKGQKGAFKTYYRKDSFVWARAQGLTDTVSVDHALIFQANGVRGVRPPSL